MNYQTKNLTVFLVLFGLIGLLFFYITTMLSVGLIGGHSKLISILKGSILEQIEGLWKHFEYYWQISWKYRDRLSLSANDYFVLKLRLASFAAHV